MFLVFYLFKFVIFFFCNFINVFVNELIFNGSVIGILIVFLGIVIILKKLFFEFL